MTTHPARSRTLVAVVAVVLAAGTSGALAGGQSPGDYASPEIIQQGYGPGGPPVSWPASVRETASAGTGRDYASPELIQLGYGPGGPSASSQR